MPPANSALDVQHGGTHYKGMAIQPITYGAANRYDPAAFSVVKYVSRHASKNGKEDLLKAIHFVDLRVEVNKLWGPLQPARTVISPEEFCRKNNMSALESNALFQLHRWVSSAPMDDVVMATLLKKQIEVIMDLNYDF